MVEKGGRSGREVANVKSSAAVGWGDRRQVCRRALEGDVTAVWADDRAGCRSVRGRRAIRGDADKRGLARSRVVNENFGLTAGLARERVDRAVGTRAQTRNQGARTARAAEIHQGNRKQRPILESLATQHRPKVLPTTFRDPITVPILDVHDRLRSTQRSRPRRSDVPPDHEPYRL